MKVEKSIVSLFMIKNYNVKQISCGCLDGKTSGTVRKHQATYNSQSFFWGLGNDKQSLWDQMFMNVVILIKILLIPAELIHGFFPQSGISSRASETLIDKDTSNLFTQDEENRVHRFWNGKLVQKKQLLITELYNSSWDVKVAVTSIMLTFSQISRVPPGLLSEKECLWP